MRRFIKTFTVRKHAQFTVVQDGAKKAFEVLRWDAGGRGPEEVGQPFPYENERSSIESARSEAIGLARKLAAEAEQSRAVQGEEPEALTLEEEEALDARAAAAAQSLTPAAQEAGRRR